MNRVLPTLALLGAALTAVGAIVDVDAFLRAWLVAALVALALPLGTLPILMTHSLTGGRWGEPLRGPLNAVAATPPWALVLFIPLLLGAPDLFRWADAPHTLPELVRAKRFYLNLPFFYARFALYALIWVVLAFRLRVFRGDAPPSTATCAAGLVLWTLTTTYFAYDWLMALEPTWYSDVVGLIFIGSILSMALALPFLLPGVFPNADQAERSDSGRIMEGARRDVAHLWLTLILFWVFVAFSQYLIIWSGDLPHEIRWYLHRQRGGWQWLALAMMLLCGLIPFLGLLGHRWKRRAHPLAVLAALVLLGHVLEFAWLVLPTYYPEGWVWGWRSPVALLTVLSMLAWLWRRRQPRAMEVTP